MILNQSSREPYNSQIQLSLTDSKLMMIMQEGLINEATEDYITDICDNH